MEAKDQFFSIKLHQLVRYGSPFSFWISSPKGFSILISKRKVLDVFSPITQLIFQMALFMIYLDNYQKIIMYCNQLF